MNNLKKQFSQIYDDHIEKIYRFVFFKVNSQEIAEDLASETFLRFWKKLNGNPNNSSAEIKNPQAFLYKIARNLVTDHYREKGKAQFVSIESSFLPDPSQNLEERVQLESDIDNIKNSLSNLKEDYQNVILWYYLDDLPISQISQLLDRTEAATRVLLHRALKALRNKLSQTV